MPRYKIADYFSREALLEAAKLSYTPLFEDKGDKWTCPRSLAGFCPLGRALTADNIRGAISPPPSKIAFLLLSKDLQEGDRIVDPEWNRLTEIATEFTTDWDYGSIKDLYEAFGLERNNTEEN